MTTIDELLEPPSEWIWNEASERGDDPDVYEEFDVLT